MLRLLRVRDWPRSPLAAVAGRRRASSSRSGSLGPLLATLGKLNLLIFFVGVVGGCVLAGVPIAFAFGLGTFGYLALTTDTPLPVDRRPAWTRACRT